MLNKFISFLTFNVLRKIIKKLELVFNGYYNYLKLLDQHINFKSMPLIKGKIEIKNNGKCYLGQNITFNSSFDANPIGLFKKCSIYVEIGGYLSIGDNSGFSGVSIYCSKEVTIGKYLFCGGNVSIWDTDFHPLNFKERRLADNSNVQSLSIKIGDDVFIGANSIILKGVTIGDNSIIGAGSVITKNIPANEIWAGNPAKYIRDNMNGNNSLKVNIDD